MFILLSCSENKTEIYAPKNRINIYNAEGKKYYNDVVFIINPPKDNNELLNLITNYNRKTINIKKIQKEYQSFERAFYRESKKTPRYFKDDEGFIPDRLDDHSYDFIGAYTIERCNFSSCFQVYLWSGIGYVGFETIYYKKCE